MALWKETMRNTDLNILLATKSSNNIFKSTSYENVMGLATSTRFLVSELLQSGKLYVGGLLYEGKCFAALFFDSFRTYVTCPSRACGGLFILFDIWA